MTQAPEEFRNAVASLRAVHPRPEIRLTPIRAPQHLTPWAYALGGQTSGPGEVLVSGRLVLLHDPEGQEGWNGVFRLIAYIRAGLDHELATDPFLPDVGWSWLTDALEVSGASWTALGGTVTETSSARFGEITGPARADDIELRASWTPTRADLQPHGEAFCQMMSNYAGLPPVGVSMFEQRQTT